MEEPDPTNAIEPYWDEMIDVCDGVYVGPLTIDELFEQYEYRIWIHESYAGLVLDDPAWLSFGTYEYHMWAINGYNEGIRHLKAKYPWWIKLLLAILRKGGR